VRPNLFVFIIWLVFPLAQHVAIALHARHPRPSCRQWALATSEDLAIAGQAWLVVWLVGAGSGSHVAVGLATLALLATTHVYLVADVLLWRHRAIRLFPSHLALLRYASSFKSSVALPELSLVLAPLIAAGAVTAAFWQTIALCGDSTTLAALPLCAAVGGTLVAAVGRRYEPVPMPQQLPNALFNAEAFALTFLTGFRKYGSSEPYSAEIRAAFLADSELHSGDANPQYPLLRVTRGFVGDRLLTLRDTANERPHVVMLFLESFRRKNVGILGGQPAVTPNFDRLAASGVLWPTFFANSMQTWRAILSSLYGVLTPSAFGSMHDILDNRFYGLPQLMTEAGFCTAFFKGGDLAFESAGPFCLAHGFAEVFGDKDIAAAFPEATGTSWGRDDEYLGRFFVDWLARQNARQKPTFSAVFTLTAHDPWVVPPTFAAPELPGITDASYRKYLHAIQYTDHCLGLLVASLRAHDLADKTLLFVLGDHGQTLWIAGREDDAQRLRDSCEVPLLLYAPGHLQQALVLPEVGSQVDLQPTIMDLLGLSGRNHGMGQSLVRKSARRQVYLTSPFSPCASALRTQDLEYVRVEGPDKSLLFDLRVDPGRCHDIAANRPNQMARMGRQLADTNRWVGWLHGADRFDARARSSRPVHEPAPTTLRSLHELMSRLAASPETIDQISAGLVRDALESALTRRAKLRYANLACRAYRKLNAVPLSRIEQSDLSDTAASLLPKTLDAWTARQVRLASSPILQDRIDARLLLVCAAAPFSPADKLRYVDLRWRWQRRTVFGRMAEEEHRELMRLEALRAASLEPAAL